MLMLDYSLTPLDNLSSSAELHSVDPNSEGVVQTSFIALNWCFFKAIEFCQAHCCISTSISCWYLSARVWPWALCSLGALKGAGWAAGFSDPQKDGEHQESDPSFPNPAHFS